MTVRFLGAPKRVELTVADNGKGFDLHAATGTRGLGLISLGERVQLLAGTFEIQSHLTQELPFELRSPSSSVIGA